MVVVKLCSLFSSIVSIEGASTTCSASTFADDSCFDGQSYDSAAAATTCTDAAADGVGCVYDDTAAGIVDNDLCCNTNTGQKCTDFISDGLCGAALTDRKASLNKCIGADCDFELPYDKKSCCKATTGQKCSLALPKDGWCTAGTTYDTTKKNNKCVGSECDKSVLDDQNSCCSKTKGTVTCKAHFGEDGVCSSSIPGLTYKKESADLLCVAACDAEKLDDTNTCCMATTGITCDKAGISQGMCGRGYEYDVKKKSNKCVDKESCALSNSDGDDAHACCSSLKGAAKCGDVKIGATAKGFCGPDQTYDATRVTKQCSGASCSKSNKDDVKTCCKANDGEGQCKSMAGEVLFCGVGKSLDPEKLDSYCIGKVCTGHEDDTGTCCMDNAGASCSDEKNGATEPLFCGEDFTYKVSAGKCEQAKCSKKADKHTCCMGNEGETCSKIEAVTTFCGTGKVIDTTRETRKCASAKCSAASAEDVFQCCKAAPKTTLTTTKAPTKNVTTPGTTGSAHANLAGTASLFFLGCLSQLM